MTYKSIFFGLMLIPAIAVAQEPIKLNMSDVTFQFRPMPKGYAFCGYRIQGNRLGREDPRTEWDINIDEIVQGDVRVAGVSAGSFVASGKTRTPRSPITALVFTTEDDPEPIPTQFVGAPGRDNGVRGMIDLARATSLFKALSNDRKIAATLKYADGSTDELQFSGYRDPRWYGGGKNSPFDECLRGKTPSTRDGWDITVGSH